MVHRALVTTTNSHICIPTLSPIANSLKAKGEIKKKKRFRGDRHSVCAHEEENKENQNPWGWQAGKAGKTDWKMSQTQRMRALGRFSYTELASGTVRTGGKEWQEVRSAADA